MKLTALYIAVVSISVSCSARIISQRSPSNLTPYPNRPVIELPLGTWAENLAVRSNGQILVNLLNTPQILQVDPLSLQKPILVHQFPNPDKNDGLLGIVEMQQDVFYVAFGSLNVTIGQGKPGTFSVWEVDMNPFQLGENESVVSPAKVQKLVAMPEAKILNGMTALDKDQNTTLIADSQAGAVWKLNVWTREYEVIIKDPLMDPGSFIGVNGIKIQNGYLYFTNSAAGSLNRVPINADGTAKAPAETVQTGLTSADDFTFDEAGNAYLVQNTVNQLTEISAKGQVTTLVGGLNDSYLSGATAVQFGRTVLDDEVLYVTTSGGQGAPVNGKIVPGKVVAVLTGSKASNGTLKSK